MLNDVRLAIRLLFRDRRFTATAVLALTLGLAANSLVVTIVNGVIWRDLPFAEPDRLVALKSVDPSGELFNLSYADLRDVRAAAPSTLAGVAGVDQGPITVVDESRDAVRRTGAFVTAGTFQLLGQPPLLGREFSPADDRPGAEPVVMLSHELWQQGFGGRADVVGASIRVDAVTATVIGVMPPGFAFPEMADVWLPLARVPSRVQDRRDLRFTNAIGRLAPDATAEQARAQLAAIGAGLGARYPDSNTGVGLSFIPYREDVVGDRAAEISSTLMGAVAALLLLACANVANLLLARSRVRAREIAIRVSMGAGRWRIVRQLLVESLVLTVVAGVAGLLVGAIAVELFTDAFARLDPPYWIRFSLDARVVAVIAAIGAATTIVFGLAPALQASKAAVTGVLGDSDRGSTGSRRLQRWSGGLIVVQVALALVLLAAGGLMLRAALGEFDRHAGINTAGLLTMRIELPRQRYESAVEQTAFYRRLDERLSALPGTVATIATPVPRMGGPERTLRIEGQPVPAGQRLPRVTTVAVGRRYFETLGIAPRQGRSFQPLDGSPGRVAVIVNERFAALYLGGGPAVGTRIELGPDEPFIGATGWMTVVGVVPNVRQNEEEETAFDPVAYLPHEAYPLPNAMLLARSSASAATVVGPIRDIVRQLDPDLPLFAIASLDDAAADALWPLRIFGTLFGTFAIAALTLAALGLYAVTSYAAVQRTRELGIRIALGARRRHIIQTVSGRVAALLAIGIAAGAGGAFATGQILQGIMGRIRGGDPVTLLAVPLLLALVGLAACLLPARRAMRVNPTEALRAD